LEKEPMRENLHDKFHALELRQKHLDVLDLEHNIKQQRDDNTVEMIHEYFETQKWQSLTIQEIYNNFHYWFYHTWIKRYPNTDRPPMPKKKFQELALEGGHILESELLMPTSSEEEPSTSDASLDRELLSVEEPLTEESAALICKYVDDNHKRLRWSIIPMLHAWYRRWLKENCYKTQGRVANGVSLKDFEAYVLSNNLIFNSETSASAARVTAAAPKMLTLNSGRSVQSPESWATMYPMAQYLRLFRGNVTRENITTRYIHYLKWMREDLYRSPLQEMPEPATKAEFFSYAQDTGFGETRVAMIAPTATPRAKEMIRHANEIIASEMCKKSHCCKCSLGGARDAQLCDRCSKTSCKHCYHGLTRKRVPGALCIHDLETACPICPIIEIRDDGYCHTCYDGFKMCGGCKRKALPFMPGFYLPDFCKDCYMSREPCKVCGKRHMVSEKQFVSCCETCELPPCLYCRGSVNPTESGSESGLCNACSHKVMACSQCKRFTDRCSLERGNTCEACYAKCPECACGNRLILRQELGVKWCSDCQKLPLCEGCNVHLHLSVHSTSKIDTMCNSCYDELPKCRCGLHMRGRGAKPAEGICGRCVRKPQCTSCGLHMYGAIIKSVIPGLCRPCGDQLLPKCACGNIVIAGVVKCTPCRAKDSISS
jgi:hypothetical protein